MRAVRRHAPGPHGRAGDARRLRAAQLGAGLSDRAPPRAGRLAAADAEQWGRYAAERFLAERAPSVAADEQAIEWYTSYISRGASPSAVAAITDMNEEIDVRPVLGSVRVPALVIHREHEYLRDASRYMGERLPGARIAELPGVDHLPWEGDQAGVLDEIEAFLARASPTRRRCRARC